MKKIITNIVAVSLAFLIAWASGGLNIYHYCCDACAAHGANMFVTITCEEVHSHHECNDPNCNHHKHQCADGCHHESHGLNILADIFQQDSNHCDMHHFDGMQLSQSINYDFNFTTPIIALPNFISCEILAELQPIAEQIKYTIYSAPPYPISGRQILATNSVFLI